MAYIPYGYRIEDGEAVADHEHCQRLYILYKLYLAGFSIRAATHLSGIPMTAKACGAMLRNRTYLGTDFYPQLIETELFTQVQEELSHRAKARSPVYHTHLRARPTPVRTSFYLEERPAFAAEEDLDPAQRAAHLFACVKAIS